MWTTRLTSMRWWVTSLTSLGIFCLLVLGAPLAMRYYPIHQASLAAGLLSGSLHALTGSDHIAAVLPLALNKRWWSSGVYGLVWGLGHGLTSFMLGYAGSSMKGLFLLETDMLVTYKYMGDLIVSITLMVIGVMGILENTEADAETETYLSVATDTPDSSSPASSGDTPSVKMSGESRKLVKALLTHSTVIINGASLGLTWDGLPSLAPAVVLDDYMVISFLSAYLISTMLTMGCAAGLMGEASYWVSQSTNANLSHRLAYLSSVSACGIGLCWFVSALSKFTVAYLNPSFSNNNDGTMLMTTNDWLQEALDTRSNALLCVGSVLVILMVMASAINKDWFCTKSKIDRELGGVQYI